MSRSLVRKLKTYKAIVLLYGGFIVLFVSGFNRDYADAAHDWSANASVASSAAETLAFQSVSSSRFADLPLAFELNTGRADPRIKFLSRQSAAELYH